MGSKRKTMETSAEDDAQQPRKRVTRASSSRKENLLAQETPPNHHDKSRIEKRKQDAKSEYILSPRESDENPVPSPSPSTLAASSSKPQSPKITTLNITHHALPSPIPCHEYNVGTPLSPSGPSTTCIFTHGAGGTISTPAVRNFCTGYARSASILVFQGSVNLAARVKGFHACLAHLRSEAQSKARKGAGNKPVGEAGGRREGMIVLGGRSMGSRAAVVAASEILSSSSSSPFPGSNEEEDEEEEEKAGASPNLSLILVSYPLQGPKKEMRDQILFDLPASVRILFIVGDRDAMCPLDLLHRTREKMVAESRLVVVKGADHGMRVRPRERETECGEETGMLAAAWLAGEMLESVVYVGGGEEA